jgi:hypothetical protein
LNQVHYVCRAKTGISVYRNNAILFLWGKSAFQSQTSEKKKKKMSGMSTLATRATRRIWHALGLAGVLPNESMLSHCQMHHDACEMRWDSGRSESTTCVIVPADQEEIMNKDVLRVNVY